MRHRPSAPGGLLLQDTSDFILVAVIVVVAVAAIGTWLAGQLAALLFHGAWLPVTIGQALAAAGRLPGHLGDPRQAWPAPVRRDLPGAAEFWAAAAITLAIITVIAVVLVQNGIARRPHAGYASRAEIKAVLSERAVIARGPVVRPSMRKRGHGEGH